VQRARRNSAIVSQDRCLRSGKFELGLAFQHVLDDPEPVAACTIEVERIAGPVLLFSAGDDRTWSCRELSQIAADRLAAADSWWFEPHAA
jgi:hypothetical protein